VFIQRLYSIHRDVDCKRDETAADDPKRYSFCSFSPLGVVKMHAPKDDRTRRDFDEAVKPEADQRNTSGHQSRNYRNERFQTVPNNREVLKALAPMNQRRSFFNA